MSGQLSGYAPSYVNSGAEAVSRQLDLPSEGIEANSAPFLRFMLFSWEGFPFMVSLILKFVIQGFWLIVFSVISVCPQLILAQWMGLLRVLTKMQLPLHCLCLFPCLS